MKGEKDGDRRGQNVKVERKKKSMAWREEKETGRGEMQGEDEWRGWRSRM